MKALSRDSNQLVPAENSRQAVTSLRLILSCSMLGLLGLVGLAGVDGLVVFSAMVGGGQIFINAFEGLSVELDHLLFQELVRVDIRSLRFAFELVDLSAILLLLLGEAYPC